MAALALFFRLIVRPAFREPARSALAIAAVALGVAVVLAIELAGHAAAGSFRSSLETMAGDDNLEVRAAGGVPEAVVGTLARLPFPLRVSPRIEDYATVVDTGESAPLIGLDMIAEAGNRQEETIAAGAGEQAFEHINDPDAVWITHSLGKQVGEKLRLLINDREGD